MNSLQIFSNRQPLPTSHKRDADLAKLEEKKVFKTSKVVKQAWTEMASHAATREEAEKLKSKSLTDLQGLSGLYSPSFKIMAASILIGIIHQIIDYDNEINNQDNDQSAAYNETSPIEDPELHTMLEEISAVLYSDPGVTHLAIENLALRIGKRILLNNPEVLIGLKIAKDEWLTKKLQAEIEKQSSIARLSESRIKLAMMQRLFAEENGAVPSTRTDLSPEELEIAGRCEQAWKDEQAKSLQSLETTIQIRVSYLTSLFSKMKAFAPPMPTFKNSISEEEVPKLEIRFAQYDPNSPEAKKAAAMTKRLQEHATNFIAGQKEAKAIGSPKKVFSTILSHLDFIRNPSMLMLGYPTASLIEIGKFLGGISTEERKEILKRNEEVAINETAAEAWSDAAERLKINKVAQEHSLLAKELINKKTRQSATNIKPGEEFDPETVSSPLSQEEKKFLKEFNLICDRIDIEMSKQKKRKMKS